MEVTLTVKAYPSPGLENARIQEVTQIIRKHARQEKKVTVDSSKSPADLGFLTTIMDFFPEEAHENVILVNAKIDGKEVNLAAPLADSVEKRFIKKDKAIALEYSVLLR
jgi:hypothetical protein